LDYLTAEIQPAENYLAAVIATEICTAKNRPKIASAPEEFIT
jgi:hypothetical protein